MSGYSNGRIIATILFQAEGKGNLDNVGLRVFGPDGSMLTCSYLGDKATIFGKCLRRKQFPDGFAFEEIELKKLKLGKYTFDFYVPDTSSIKSVTTKTDSYMKLYSRKDGGMRFKAEHIVIKAGAVKDLLHLTVN